MSKEREELVTGKQVEELKFQRSLAEAKQKADLRVAAIKRQLENDQSLRAEDLSGERRELQAKVIIIKLIINSDVNCVLISVFLYLFMNKTIKEKSESEAL